MSKEFKGFWAESVAYVNPRSPREWLVFLAVYPWNLLKYLWYTWRLG